MRIMQGIVVGQGEVSLYCRGLEHVELNYCFFFFIYRFCCISTTDDQLEQRGRAGKVHERTSSARGSLHRALPDSTVRKTAAARWGVRGSTTCLQH